MADTEVPKKLLVIAVEVDSGKINEPGIPNSKPRVVGVVNDAVFDTWVQGLLSSQPPQAELPTKADHGSRKHPYVTFGPDRPTHIATILHTINSPGCTWVTVNGWPFCY
jgi:hypothetical protein